MGKLGITTVVSVLFASCNNVGEGVYINEIHNSWAKDKIEVFQFEIKDSEIPKNIIFVVKNNEEYPYSNLRLISSVTGTGIKEEKDTLNYFLAKPNGEWLGTGFGKMKEIKFQYKINYKFLSNGVYRIEVKQAMRKDTLRGIENFGIIIEQAQP